MLTVVISDSMAGIRTVVEMITGFGTATTGHIECSEEVDR